MIKNIYPPFKIALSFLLILSLMNMLMVFDVALAQNVGVTSNTRDSSANDDNLNVINILEVKDMMIKDVLGLMMLKSGLNIVADDDIDGRVTIFLKDVDARDALRIILDGLDLAYDETDRIISVMTAEKFEEKYGYPFGQKIQTKIIQIVHSKPDDVLGVLKALKSDSGKIIYNDTTQKVILIDSPEKILSMTAVIKQMDVPINTETFKANFVQISDMVEKINNMLSSTVGQMNVDVANNSVTITDNINNLKDIKQLILKADLEHKQFKVEVKTIQVLLDDEHPQGVDWEAIISKYKKIKMDPPVPVNEHGFLSVGALNEEDYSVLLEALDTVGAVNNLANQILISTNHEKSIVPVYSMPDRITAEQLVNRSFDAGDELLRYHIKPAQRVDSLTQLHIQPEILFKDQDSLLLKEIVMDLDDQETVIVGGFFKEIILESIKKFPVLGDIPLLGFAFSRQKSRIRKTELMIFFTPQLNTEQ